MPSVLIMAGGVGERFWPASTPAYPKQYLPLTGNMPMILETVYRVKDLVGLERVFVITTEAQLALAKEILSCLPAENIIAEPEGRNTAPCLALSVAHIKQRHGSDEVVAVLPADHFIRDINKFQRSLDLAYETAKTNAEIVTFGIKPDRPETGYGYIAFGNELEPGIHQGLRFVEKPDYNTAKEYLENGQFLWNSGMFVFRVQTLIELLRQYAPELYQGYMDLENCRDSTKVADIYRCLPKTSIDYGLMEVIPSFLVIPGDYGWDDLGSWRALETIHPKDDYGNVVLGQAELLHVSNTTVFSNNKLVAAIGVENLIIVETDEATLVCPKDRVQEVKKLVEQIKGQLVNRSSCKLVAAGNEL